MGTCRICYEQYGPGMGLEDQMDWHGRSHPYTFDNAGRHVAITHPFTGSVRDEFGREKSSHPLAGAILDDTTILPDGNTGYGPKTLAAIDRLTKSEREADYQAALARQQRQLVEQQRVEIDMLREQTYTLSQKAYNSLAPQPDTVYMVHDGGGYSGPGVADIMQYVGWAGTLVVGLTFLFQWAGS